jgi:hypothetical protein
MSLMSPLFEWIAANFAQLFFTTIIFVIWGIILLEISKSRKFGEGTFFLVLFAPMIAVVATLLLTGALFALIFNFLGLIISILLILYWFLWGKTLWEVAGNDELFAFWSILLIPALWILYRFWQWR